MYIVKDLLQGKGDQVWAISPQATVYEALELMANKNIGALVVTENGKLVGILTERDYARKVVLLGRSSKSTTVAELMSTDVVCVTRDDTIEHCMGLMTEKRTRHLPVLEDGRLLGLISIG